MKYNKSRVATAIVIVLVFAAITIYGLVWTVCEAVKGSDYLKAHATITECLTEDIDGIKQTIQVTMLCTAQTGETFEAQFIGDLTKCVVGQQLTVYYKAEDMAHVYPRSSDVGFSLIMFIGGLIWIIGSIVAIIALYRSGAFLVGFLLQFCC